MIDSEYIYFKYLNLSHFPSFSNKKKEKGGALYNLSKHGVLKSLTTIDYYF